MDVLPDVCLLAAPTFRSRAYIQAMTAAGILPSRVISLPGEEPVWTGPKTEVLARLAPDQPPMRFRPAEPLSETLRSHRLPVIAAPTNDINAQSMIEIIFSIIEKIVIYSGVGGAILRKEILQTGKRFVHVHGGYAPAYRGSTAFYFSLIKEGTIGATVLCLDQGIDTGPILARRRYAPEQGIEIDRLLDPMARAQLLVEVLEEYRKTGALPSPAQPSSKEPAETYRVIHPVLKHLALRTAGLTPKPHR